MIRLGGPVAGGSDAETWIREVQAHGYTAAYCPDLTLDDSPRIAAYRLAAERANIMIAEVGAWSNPLSTDEIARKQAIRHCKERLALAEAVGANCCVNIAGSLGDTWDGPHPDHYADATFALIVDTVRDIIDAVRPANTYYALEMMPWMLPDDADSCLALLKAVDRPAFAVHLDPVNIVTSPRLYADTGRLLRELFDKLGPWIRSCHAKDIVLSSRLTVHLDETVPGRGKLDYPAYLTLLEALERDVPLMLEHLESQQHYAEAASFIRGVAGQLQIPI